MAGRFKRTKDVGPQSSRPANLSATNFNTKAQSTARQRANDREARELNEQSLDQQFGYSLLRSTPPDNKPAYMYNMRQARIRDNESGLLLSCLEMYFIQESGTTFKAAHIYSPYFLIQIKGNTTVFGEVEQYLMYKYKDEVVKCTEIMKEDLEMPNHLSGLQRKFMKLSFRNVDDLVNVRRTLQPVIEKNKLAQAKNDDVGLEGFTNSNHQGGDLEMKDSSVAASSAASIRKKKNRENCMTAVVDIREYDVLYVQRVSIDTGYRCGLWYEVVPEEGTGSCTLTPRSDILDQAPLRKMAFDIETTKPPLKFPQAETDNIMMISYMIDGEGFLICNRAIISEDINDFEYTPRPEYIGEFTVYNVPDEKALLEKWFSHIEEVKPQLYVTYNGDFFDWPFIAKRCEILGFNLQERIGIYENQGEYMGRFSIHLDAFKWVQRDSYLPQGSQGLKAVTKHKLKYEPVELDPEDMLPYAREHPQELASYSVSDAVATYYLYMKYVHLFVFSLATIIPMPPSDVLRKGSGTLCELLLMVQAYEHNIVCPNKEKTALLQFHAGHLLESETYIGGHVECLESGVFRADIPMKFKVSPKRMQTLIDDLDRTLRFAIEVEGLQKMENIDMESFQSVKAQITEKLVSLRETPSIEVKPLIYHLDVGAMYPNIILTNRLQPMAIVDSTICASCDFNRPGMQCQRWMKWSWRGRYYPATHSEYQQIKAQLEVEPLKHDAASRELRVEPKSFLDLPFDQQAARIQSRVKSYSTKVYKGFAREDTEERAACICQRENPFYVDTVRAFRDRRYEYKRLGKQAKKDVDQAADELSKVKANDRLLLYDSLQLAHKCILNSFYGYVMRRGARWHSIEMAGVVTQTGANLIKDARVIVEEIGRPLELDTDGIWCLPESDSRVLTSNGFLSLPQIESLINTRNHSLLFASYNVKNRTIEYLPGELIVRDNQLPPERLVDFTQGASRHFWESTDSSSTSSSSTGQSTSSSSSPSVSSSSAAVCSYSLDHLMTSSSAASVVKVNHVSLRVTPLHDMFVQLVNRTTDTVHPLSISGVAVPFKKMKAEELTPGRVKHSTLQFLHAAEFGCNQVDLSPTDDDPTLPVRALNLSTQDSIDAFIELYGFWLGDGSIKYQSGGGGANAVLFSTVNDEHYLRALFKRIGLVESSDWMIHGPYPTPIGHTVVNLHIVNKSWFNYFDEEYWIKYKTGRLRRDGLAHSLASRLPYLNDCLDPFLPSSSASAEPSSSSGGKRTSPASSRSSSPSGVRDHKRTKTDLSSSPSVSRRSSLNSEVDPHFTAAELAKIAVLRKRGIEPPNVNSAKWFWWWVLKRLSARQIGLMVRGLRCADGDWALTREQKQQQQSTTSSNGDDDTSEGMKESSDGVVGSSDVANAETQGFRTIYASSVNFRDFVVQACLHAGFTACVNYNRTDADRVQWCRVPDDGHFYSSGEMAEAVADDSSAVFKEFKQNAINWRVCFSANLTRLVDVVDVCFDGKPMLDTDQIVTPPSAATGRQSPRYSYEKDGRLWCIRLPVQSDQLIIAQRYQRGDDGIIGMASRPMILGNCMLPSTFPETFKVKLTKGGSVPISYPCSMLNVGVADNYTNSQYWGKKPDGTMGYISECSIFFEVDGPYRAMVLPAAREEGKNIKKRYAVFDHDGSLAELKGFEIKRRGELKLIKIFQEQVFKRFLDGKTLQECYDSVGAAANHWLDVCYNQGHDLEDDDVFELISENKSMSEALSEYGDRKSTSIQTARRLGEFLGEEMVKDKGLNCKFIITKKPLGAPTSERAVPVAIFSAEEAIKKAYLRKWLKDSSLSDFDVRTLLDWDYYIGRLNNAIQKIITIPAAFQKIRNPVERVPHPDWLTKRVKERDDTHKQTRIASFFHSVAAASLTPRDMEDIGSSQFTNPLKPKFAVVHHKRARVPPAATIEVENEDQMDDVQIIGERKSDETEEAIVRESKKSKRTSAASSSSVVAGTGLLDDDNASHSSNSNHSPTARNGKRERRIVELDADGAEIPQDDDDDDGDDDDEENDQVEPLLPTESSDLIDKAIDISSLRPEQFSPKKKSRNGFSSASVSAASTPTRAKLKLDYGTSVPKGAITTLVCEEQPTDANFTAWMSSLKSTFTKINKSKRQARLEENRLKAGHINQGEQVKLGRDGLAGFLKKQQLAVRASYWQIIQMFEDDIVPGLFRVWVILDSGLCRQMLVHVPRVIYVNSRSELIDNGKKVQRFLPRGRPCLNLYELSMSETEFIQHQTEYLSSLQNRHEIEGVYETQVSLQFKLIMELGCVCKVDSRVVPASNFAANEHTLDQLVYKTTAECPYLHPSTSSLRKIYLYYSVADAKRGVFGIFIEGRKDIQVVVVNGWPADVEKVNFKKLLTDCIDSAKHASSEVMEGEHDGGEFNHSQSHNKFPSPNSIFAPQKVVKNHEDGFEYVNELLREYRTTSTSPCVILAQVAGLSLPTLYSKLPSLKTDYPVIMVPANLSDNKFESPPKAWYRPAIQRMIERYVSYPQWWIEQLHNCQYAHVPIGNMESDHPSYIQDLFFARALKHSGHLLWISKGSKPDLGGLEEDENYFADEHINPEASKPGVYRKVCMEIEIQSLAINAIVNQTLIEENEGNMNLAESSSLKQSNLPQGADSELLSLRSLQEGSQSCVDAFRILKNCVTNWYQDALGNQNADADMLLMHFYRWLRSPSSQLYDGALHRYIHALMKKILAQLLAQFRKLGSTVVYANQNKIIIATNKADTPHALSYTKFILDTIQEKPLFANMRLEATKIWEVFAFMDVANYGGIQPSELMDSDRTQLTMRTLPDGSRTEILLDMEWSVARYLSFGEAQKTFLLALRDFICLPGEVRAEEMNRLLKKHGELNSSQSLQNWQLTTEKAEESIQRKIAEVIETSFARQLYDYVETIKKANRGDERSGEDKASGEFPILAGSHLPLHNPALEFVKTLCAVMNLDTELATSVRRVRESLMKLVAVKSFSAQADFINPCLTFVLPDVMCSFCNSCRDLDLCRDRELVTTRKFACALCRHEYDRDVIESQLVEYISKRGVAYQVQDLQCHTCGKIKVTNMGKYCPCSGHFVNTMTHQQFDTLLRTFANISVYHKFDWLRETVVFLREREPEITEFDDPSHADGLAATLNNAAGVGDTDENQIEIE